MTDPIADVATVPPAPEQAAGFDLSGLGGRPCDDLEAALIREVFNIN